MKPIQVSTKTQTWIHIGMVLAQFAVMAFVKDPALKAQIQTGIALAQSSGAVGMQDKTKPPMLPSFDPETNKFTGTETHSGGSAQ